MISSGDFEWVLARARETRAQGKLWSDVQRDVIEQLTHLSKAERDELDGRVLDALLPETLEGIVKIGEDMARSQQVEPELRQLEPLSLPERDAPRKRAPRKTPPRGERFDPHEAQLPRGDRN